MTQSLKQRRPPAATFRPRGPGPRDPRRLGPRVRRLAFRPGHGHALLARLRRQARLGPAAGDPRLRRSGQAGPLPGRMAPRRPGAALGSQGLRRSAGLRLRDRRQHGHPQEPHQHRRLPHRLLDVQRHAQRQVLSPRRQLADARSLGPAAAAAGRRAPGPGPRRHLLLHRSRSPLGHPPDQAGAVRRAGGLQGPLHPAGPDDPAGEPRNQVHVHHAQAAGGPLREDLAEEGGHHRRLLRRHGDDAAVPPLRPRGTAGRGRLRPDLRQHADGPGLQQAVRSGRRLLDHLSRPAAPGRAPGGRIPSIPTGSSSMASGAG